MSRNTVIAVVGRKGSGKSFLVREIVAEHPRVLVIDSLAEYGPRCGCTVAVEEECPDAVLAALRQDRYRLALRCLSVEDNLDLLRLCYECPGAMIVVEEASLYASPRELPEEIAQLIRYGRHRELDLVFVARRPAELHRDVTANCDLLVAFHTQEPRDIDYLRSFYGDEAFELPAMRGYQVKVFGDLSHAPRAVLRRMMEKRS